MITLSALRDAVGQMPLSGGCVASKPAGGAGDKVFPPTYPGERRKIRRATCSSAAELVTRRCGASSSIASRARRTAWRRRCWWRPRPMMASAAVRRGGLSRRGASADRADHLSRCAAQGVRRDIPRQPAGRCRLHAERTRPAPCGRDVCGCHCPARNVAHSPALWRMA